MDVRDYPIRPGCIDFGKDFEFRMAALLILRCIATKKVEDVWVAMNVDKCGAFDDVILSVRMMNRNIIYLIQLKHQVNPENITAREFRTKDSGFRLAKYHNTILEIKTEISKDNVSSQIMGCFKENWDNLIFILFTNRGVNENDFLKNVDKKSDVDLKWCLYENVETNNGKVFSFDCDKLNIDKAIQDFVEDRFFLFIKQIHIDKIDNEIENAICRIIHPLKLSKNNLMEVTQKFLLFITEWSIGNLGGYYPLTKNHVLRVLFDFLIAPHALILSECVATADVAIWKNIIENKKITVIEEDDAVIEYLMKFISSEVKAYCDEPKNKNLWKKHTDTVSKTILRSAARAKKDIRFFDAYECLWKNCDLPLILRVNENNLKDIETILNILKSIQEPLRVILLSNCKISFLDTGSSFSTLQHLNEESSRVILNYPVKLQGRSSIKIIDFIDKQMFNSITARDIIYILSDKFNIGSQLSPRPDIYIERTLERVFLDPLVLKEEIDDIFVIKCNLVDDFRIFKENSSLDGIEFQIFEDAENVVECRIVVYENRNAFAFEDLEREMNDVPIHYLFLRPQAKLEWIKSIGCVRNITKFRINLDFSNFYRSSDIFKSDVSRTHIISAYPGMGKSVLMDDIAQDIPTDTWVLRINLFEHCDYYKSDEFEDCDALEYLKYFNNKIITKEKQIRNLDEVIFERYLSLENVTILLDGFDEVPVNLQAKVKEMLKSFQDSGYVVYVTTRPILRLQLEELLDTLAVSINPFTVKDQESFLNQYFLNASIMNQNEKIEAFVKRLLKAAKANLNDYEREFTGVPLQTMLLAEVFTSDFIKFTGSGNFECEHFDLLYLYKNFINQKIKIVCDKFGNSSEDMLHRYKTHRSLSALQVLFSKDALQDLNIQQLLDLEMKVFPETLQLVQKDGIIIAESSKNITFVHRTFAEYLAAEWLSENVDGEHRRIVITLIKQTFNSNFEVVRNIFDRILAKKCPLHLAIINRRIDLVKEIINSGKFDTAKVDKCKRSFLHVIASWGVHHPQKLEGEIEDFEDKVVKDKVLHILRLIPNDFLKISKDGLLNYTPLDYAVLSNSLSIANEICSRLEHIDDYISFDVDDLNSITYYLNKCNYASFGSVLIKHSIVSELHNIIRKLKESYGKDKNSLQYNIIQNNIKDVSTLLTFEQQKINDTDEQGYSLLHIATIFDRSLICQMLIVNEANLEDVKDCTGKTALHWACAMGNLKTLALLLSHRADITALDNDGMSALHYAVIASSKNKNAIISKLLEANADLTILDYNGKTPLHYALHYNHTKILRTLLNYGANINASCEDTLQKILSSRDSDSGTILHWAADKGSTELVKLLIQYGADVEIKDNGGNTPLHWAVEKGHIDVVKLLLTYQKDVDLHNAKGMTPLHLAAHHGHESIIDLFASTNESITAIKSVNIEDKNAYGNTALMMAVSNNQISVSELLLSKNANVEEKNNIGMNPLLYASDRGYNDIIELLLSKNADVEAKNDAGLNALLYAADKGNNRIIELLLSLNADIEAQDRGGNTALLYAIHNGHVETLELLLTNNANVAVRDTKGRSALHYAVLKDHKRIIQILLSKDIDVEAKDEGGETPLHYAAYEGNTAALELLISKNAYIDAQTKDGETALHYAASKGHNNSIGCLLLNNATIDHQNKNGRTALFNAIYFGHTETTALLLSKGSNIEARDIEGNTPLLRAAYVGRFDCVKLLLHKGADRSAKSNDGNDALLRAAFSGHTSIIELLVSWGMDVNSQNDLGNSALHLNSYNGRTDVVELLLSYKANLELKDKKGNTALIYAAFNGKIEAARLLLSNNASIESTNNKGETPLLYAADQGHTNIVDLLLSENANIEAKNDGGNTPLLGAAINGHIDTINLLLSKNADVNVTNNEGNNALHRAACQGHIESIDLFLARGIDMEAENTMQCTAYELAVYNNHKEALELFLSKAEDEETKYRIKLSALRIAVANDLGDILEFLLTEGVDIETKWDEGRNALFLASYFGHGSIVETLISAGANLNVRDDNNNTALHIAANNGHAHVVNLLLLNGANGEIRNDSDLSALNIAEFNDYYDVVQLFLNRSTIS